MTINKVSSTIGGRRGFVAAALVLGMAAVMSGCARPDGMSTGSLPDDYRTRHAIVVGETEKVLDIPIASGDRRLSTGQSEVIAGFASNYLGASSGTIQIIAPHGAPNTSAAMAASADIRKLLRRMGVADSRIVQTSYAADGYGAAAPVRLSYTAITAHTQPCGEWPEDMTLNTTQNNNYYNFGCANQANLAAQIANPNDLLGPRRMTPIDAAQREQAIERYRGAYTELEDM